MNAHLQNILDIIQQSEHLNAQEKTDLLRSAKAAEKEFEITEFKLDRTEKVKRTTAVLLEETIEELEQKRKAVEATNRELEIESSLERVRTVAMAMNRRDDMLLVCRMISEQLGLLNIKEIRNVQTAIIYESKGTYLNYEYYAKYNSSFTTEVDFKNHPIQEKFAHQMLKGAEEIFIEGLKGAAVKKWYDYQKTTNQFADPYLETADSLTYYWYSLGPVALGMSTYAPLNEEEIILFKRFRNVFDLAYRRFLDIEKADAQAQEARIETSLERIRAQAMAMRTPEDLTGICEVLYVELHTLGFAEIRNAMINIHDDEKETFVNYDYSDEMGKSINHLVYNIHPVIEKQIKQMRSAGDAFSETHFKGKDLQDWKAFRKEIGEKNDPRIDKADALYYYFYSIGTGSIGISTFSVIADEKLDVLKRFRNVFNLSYQRYADIALAEEQAQEAKIEASLERMRAATMSMQKSDEIIQVSESMYKELTALGFSNIRNAQIAIQNESKQAYTVFEYSDFAAGKGDAAYNSSPIMEELYNELGKIKDTFYQKEFSGKEFIEWRKWRKTLPVSSDSRIDTAESVCFYLYSFGTGHLGISTFNSISDEQIGILKRFKKVFELSYQRYTDVAKAEEQARTAQIELALERVRARTMAMQKSDELAEAATLVFQQFSSLGLLPDGSRVFFSLIDEETVTAEIWTTKEDGILRPGSHRLSLKANRHLTDVYESWKAGKSIYNNELTGTELTDYLGYISSVPNLKEDKALQEAVITPPEHLVFTEAFFAQGTIGVIGFIPLLPESQNTLIRFAKVFEQTYTRFLDLQKAEAQAKEAKIETALERVRSRTMAMHHTSELQEVIHTVHKELLSLDISIDGGSFIVLNKDIDSHLRCWGSGGTANTSEEVHLPRYEKPFCTNLINGIKNGPGFFTEEFTQEEKKEFFSFLLEHKPWSDLGNEEKNEILSSTGGYTRSCCVSQRTAIFIINHLGRKFTANENDILKRFAKVFEQTYTRFLDLQKAEAQGREAQIELALERVRARTMAMQNSDELKYAATLLFQQAKSLGVPAYSCGYNIWKNGEKEFTSWMSTQDGTDINGVPNIPLTEDANFIRYVESKQKDEPFFVLELRGERMQEHYKYLKTIPAFAAYFDYAVSVGFDLPQTQIHHVANFAQGNLLFITLDICPEFHDVFKRFAVVFEQTYTRFLDLQKAEAQVRESRIEAALEKVRSRTMAMQRSDELAGTAALLFREFQKLEEQELIQTTIGIYNEGKNEIEFRATNWEGGGEQVARPSYGSMDEPTLLKPAVTAWKAKAKSVALDLTGEKLEGWVNYRNGMTGVSISAKDAGGRRVVSIAFFSKGHLSLSSPLPLPAETLKTLERFAAVFDGTYTRFLDLEKAEAQAREAQIEAALERVRSRTLAMHKSEELAETAVVLFQQLIALGIEPNRLYIGIIKDESGDMEMWATDEDGTKVGTKFLFNKNENKSVKKLYDGWQKKKKSVVVDMQGKELEDYFNYLNNILHIPFKGGLAQKRRVQSVAYFSKGFIGMASPDEQETESVQLLERFAAVFNLTYTRFNDLQIAEAQTHKANIEVALERVRARALAMHQPEELVEVAEVMRYEMGLLGVEELETASIYINKENINDAECWYSLKGVRAEEKKTVADHFNLNYADTWVGRQMLEFYRTDKKETSINMQGAHRKEWINYCAKQSPVFDGFYGDVIPDRIYHLCKFSNGAVGAATPGDISEESRELLRRAAAVFSLAYSRFKDLTNARTDLYRLKEEKRRAETALTELKATQTQLVQSEKMASLGELTAGIAHEIQNPLNFVNNFSEVSKELLGEMREAFEKGDMDEVKEIMSDVIQNLDKINHHGKRADGIVKGMLQHSRSSSGQKEPTDINALCDEYLRLAYHGLRAKNKSFNATMKTDFDETIGSINIISQDIGRVILNLITNAFYVVGEKKTLRQARGDKSYEPTVSVSTKEVNNNVEIKIADNGNGIPKNILDKIFQPFFTTKPTGQGTGLGLSLSYDIVKAHGGELKVETEEGIGSTFIIHLPATKN